MFVTPFNSIPNVKELEDEKSWTYGRMPEYLWIGLILKKFGRDDGFQKLSKIISLLHEIAPELYTTRMSQILKLPDEKQSEFYHYIVVIGAKEALAPLTIFLTASTAPLFAEPFYCAAQSVKDRCNMLIETMRDWMEKLFIYTIDDLDKPKERRKGTRYIVSPYRLLINDGNYYLLGYDEEKHKMLTYRVDRMKDVRCMGEPREGEEAAAAIEISKYAQQCFSMFGGQTTRVQIRFINMLLDTVIDRFGKNGVEYAKLDDGHFTITAEVRVSDPFFSWVCTFGRRAKILYPDSVVASFKAYLDKIWEMYESC